jgi:hypothetical protein
MELCDAAHGREGVGLETQPQLTALRNQLPGSSCYLDYLIVSVEHPQCAAQHCPEANEVPAGISFNIDGEEYVSSLAGSVEVARQWALST